MFTEAQLRVGVLQEQRFCELVVFVSKACRADRSFISWRFQSEALIEAVPGRLSAIVVLRRGGERSLRLAGYYVARSKRTRQ